MRKIEKVDQNGQFEMPYDARITRADDGPVGTKKYIVTAERMDDVNWRDDDSLSFWKRNTDDLPGAKEAETQIITKSNGETWIIPPLNSGDAKAITAPNINVQKVISETIAGMGLANGSVPGLTMNDYSTADKTKLGGIAAGAQVNTIDGATVGGVPVGVSSKILQMPAYPVLADVLKTQPVGLTDGINALVSENHKIHLGHISSSSVIGGLSGEFLVLTYRGPGTSADHGWQKFIHTATGREAMRSATSASAWGTIHPLLTKEDKVKLDGIQPGAEANPPVATQSTIGLMSASDKTKLDGIQAGAEANPPVATQSTNGLMSAPDKVKLDSFPSTIPGSVVLTDRDYMSSSGSGFTLVDNNNQPIVLDPNKNYLLGFGVPHMGGALNKTVYLINKNTPVPMTSVITVMLSLNAQSNLSMHLYELNLNNNRNLSFIRGYSRELTNNLGSFVLMNNYGVHVTLIELN